MSPLLSTVRVTLCQESLDVGIILWPRNKSRGKVFTLFKAHSG